MADCGNTEQVMEIKKRRKIEQNREIERRIKTERSVDIVRSDSAKLFSHGWSASLNQGHGGHRRIEKSSLAYEILQ